MDDARFRHDDAALDVVDPDVPRAARARRRQRAFATGIAFVVVLLSAAFAAQAGNGGGSSPAAGPKVVVTADAIGVSVVRPKLAPLRIARAHPVAGGVERQSASEARHVIDETGSLSDVQRIRSEAALSVQERRASAVATIEHAELFDGRVTIEGARLSAVARSADGRASGSLTLADSTRVTIDGDVVEATPNRQVAIEGIGTLILNEQAVVSSAPTGDEQTGPRRRVVGAIAHIRVTTAHGAIGAGTEIIIGRVDAGVREGKVTAAASVASGSDPVPASAAPIAPTTGSNPLTEAGIPKPGMTSLPRRAATVRAGQVNAPSSSLQGYVFPVLGRTDFSNDWGAARASTGVPHQGTDIFADEGTPVVALADGVLDRVGWNRIGGYRLWVFDTFGNSFYYAHLSAYAPLAQDGARVRAGDVIGFVGHTGDAQGTPPHLHFEVHPGNGAPTNPFPLLNAWKRGVAVAIGLLAGDAASGRVAASTLLGYSDISPNSGLQGSVLDSVPETSARPIEEESVPQPSADALRGAIDGPAISGG